jgi:hypothetical protein
MKAKTTEQDLLNGDYVYLGVYGVAPEGVKPNELWRRHDELVLFDPEEERIIWKQLNEPRYQTKGGM